MVFFIKVTADYVSQDVILEERKVLFLNEDKPKPFGAIRGYREDSPMQENAYLDVIVPLR